MTLRSAGRARAVLTVGRCPNTFSKASTGNTATRPSNTRRYWGCRALPRRSRLRSTLSPSGSEPAMLQHSGKQIAPALITPWPGLPSVHSSGGAGGACHQALPVSDTSDPAVHRRTTPDVRRRRSSRARSRRDGASRDSRGQPPRRRPDRPLAAAEHRRRRRVVGRVVGNPLAAAADQCDERPLRIDAEQTIAAARVSVKTQRQVPTRRSSTRTG